MILVTRQCRDSSETALPGLSHCSRRLWSADGRACCRPSWQIGTLARPGGSCCRSNYRIPGQLACSDHPGLHSAPRSGVPGPKGMVDAHARPLLLPAPRRPRASNKSSSTPAGTGGATSGMGGLSADVGRVRGPPPEARYWPLWLPPCSGGHTSSASPPRRNWSDALSQAMPPTATRTKKLRRRRRARSAQVCGEEGGPDVPAGVGAGHRRQAGFVLTRRTSSEDNPHPSLIDFHAASAADRGDRDHHRHRHGQRLPHRPTMHAMTLGQLTGRQLLPSPVPPDLLEQLHPRPHLTDLPADNRQGRSQRGWGQHS